MAKRVPFAKEKTWFALRRIWWNVLTSKDWLQAFEAHPRIEIRRHSKEIQKIKTVWESGEQVEPLTA